MGILDRVKSAFKSKKEEEEPVVRLGKTQEEKEQQEDNEPLYLKAKKWREAKAAEEPLVKRSEYKRKY
ncbi:MAG TPA: hypothetical protein PKK60_00545 [archaeon]|nr:hypothetical protein [archaeon]